MRSSPTIDHRGGHRHNEIREAPPENEESQNLSSLLRKTQKIGKPGRSPSPSTVILPPGKEPSKSSSRRRPQGPLVSKVDSAPSHINLSAARLQKGPVNKSKQQERSLSGRFQKELTTLGKDHHHKKSSSQPHRRSKSHELLSVNEIEELIEDMSRDSSSGNHPFKKGQSTNSRPPMRRSKSQDTLTALTSNRDSCLRSSSAGKIRASRVSFSESEDEKEEESIDEILASRDEDDYASVRKSRSKLKAMSNSRRDANTRSKSDSRSGSRSRNRSSSSSRRRSKSKDPRPSKGPTKPPEATSTKKTPNHEDKRTNRSLSRERRSSTKPQATNCKESERGETEITEPLLGDNNVKDSSLFRRLLGNESPLRIRTLPDENPNVDAGTKRTKDVEEQSLDDIEADRSPKNSKNTSEDMNTASKKNAKGKQIEMMSPTDLTPRAFQQQNGQMSPSPRKLKSPGTVLTPRSFQQQNDQMTPRSSQQQNDQMSSSPRVVVDKDVSRSQQNDFSQMPVDFNQNPFAFSENPFALQPPSPSKRTVLTRAHRLAIARRQLSPTANAPTANAGLPPLPENKQRKPTSNESAKRFSGHSGFDTANQRGKTATKAPGASSHYSCDTSEDCSFVNSSGESYSTANESSEGDFDDTGNSYYEARQESDAKLQGRENPDFKTLITVVPQASSSRDTTGTIGEQSESTLQTGESSEKPKRFLIPELSDYSETDEDSRSSSLQLDSVHLIDESRSPVGTKLLPERNSSGSRGRLESLKEEIKELKRLVKEREDVIEELHDELEERDHNLSILQMENDVNRDYVKKKQRRPKDRESASGSFLDSIVDVCGCEAW